MADFRINVIIDPKRAQSGARQVERSLDRVDRRAERTRELLSRAFAFVGTGVLVQQITTLVDTYDNLVNRLRTVTDSTEELVVINQELLDLSNRSRSSFESSVELFARVSRATQNLGISQRQVIQFTESLNQAILLSGATAIEAEAGLIQLAQGLASGRLQGDELRSVLEQLPEVANIIADSLGVTIGQLRELGSQGQITAQVVLDAFRNAEGDLRERFGRLAPTIGQAFTVLRNNTLAFIGGLSESLGVSRRFAQVILVLADNLELLARAALAAGIALAIGFARRGVGAAISAVRALTVAIAANPLGALLVAITAATAALIAFSDQITIGQNSLTTIADVGVAAVEIISEAWARLVNFLAPIFNSVSGLFGGFFNNVSLSFRGIVEVAARSIDAVLGFWRGWISAALTIFDGLVVNVTKGFVDLFNSISRRATDFINGLINNFNKVSEFLGLSLIEPIEAFQLEGPARAFVTGGDVANAFADGFRSQTAAQDVVEELFQRADQVAQNRIAAAEAEALTLDRVRESLGAPGGPAAAAPVAEVQEVETILDRVRKEFTDTAFLIESALTNAFQAGEDALVSFFTTGKFGFSDLVASIQQDLTRIAVRQAITAPLAGALLPAGGTAAGLFGGFLPGFQNGGSFMVGGRGGTDQNLLSLNNQPVARVSKGETVSVDNGGQQPININFNISTPNADSFQRSQEQIFARAGAAINRAQRRNN